LRYLGVRITATRPLTSVVLALFITGCALGGGRDPGLSSGGLTRDQLLSELAACHLLRVAQAGDKSVTDATVVAAVKRFGLNPADLVERANQLIERYRANGTALGRRAASACVNLAAITQVTPGLVRFERSGQARTAWLQVNAEITVGFANRVIRELRATRAVGLIINSPGGSVFEARKLGRYLRANGLRTAVDQICVSACIDILAGGTERFATPAARLGVHQSRVPGRYSSYEGGQVYVADSFRYLREMGVDADVAIAAASVPSNKILLIPLNDALATRLLTAVVERF
jgi:hypothetical protein